MVNGDGLNDSIEVGEVDVSKEKLCERLWSVFQEVDTGRCISVAESEEGQVLAKQASVSASPGARRPSSQAYGCSSNPCAGARHPN